MDAIVVTGNREARVPLLSLASRRLQSFRLRLHRLAALAEKLVTMVARGDISTHDRDFAGVLLLADHHDIEAADLSEAIAATAGEVREASHCASQSPVVRTWPARSPGRGLRSAASVSAAAARDG